MKKQNSTSRKFEAMTAASAAERASRFLIEGSAAATMEEENAEAAAA